MWCIAAKRNRPLFKAIQSIIFSRIITAYFNDIINIRFNDIRYYFIGFKRCPKIKPTF